MIIDSRSYIEVSEKALSQNYKNITRFVGKNKKYMVMVKSDAYGHGLTACGKVFAGLGAAYLGVDTVEEGIVLRKSGVKQPILVVGYIEPSKYPIAAMHGLSVMVSNTHNLHALHRISMRYPLDIHFKVDTGLHRQGFLFSDLSGLFKTLIDVTKNKKIKVAGLFSHLSDAENKKGDNFTIHQLRTFERFRNEFFSNGYSPLTHISATAGALMYDTSGFDIVRIGIGVYGLWPSEFTRDTVGARVKLTPALTWRSIVGDIRVLEKGEPVGYDRTETVKRTTKVAVVPVGYFHGYPWAASSKGFVLVSGETCKILGRISMNMMSIDVTNVKSVATGDTVVLIGTSKKESVTAEDVAKAAGSFNYEVVSRINLGLERRYV